MSGWWRIPSSAFSEHRLQLLDATMFRHWFNLNCIAAEYDGNLPPLVETAFKLQMKPEKAAQIIARLCAAGLLRKTATGFSAENTFPARMWKDGGNAQRVRRHRANKRNYECNGARSAETDSRSKISETAHDVIPA